MCLIAHVVLLEIYIQPHSPTQDHCAGAVAAKAQLLKAAKFHLICVLQICRAAEAPWE